MDSPTWERVTQIIYNFFKSQENLLLVGPQAPTFFKSSLKVSFIEIWFMKHWLILFFFPFVKFLSRRGTLTLIKHVVVMRSHTSIPLSISGTCMPYFRERTMNPSYVIWKEMVNNYNRVQDLDTIVINPIPLSISGINGTFKVPLTYVSHRTSGF